MVFDFSQTQAFLQLLLAAFLGAVIGLEREYKAKEAGLKTFSLVSFGSCLFTLIAVYLAGSSQVDPSRVIQAVAIGVGFLGSGVIIYRQAQIEGLTTAAGLWAVAAVGVGVGLKLYFLSVLGAVVIVAILVGFRVIEKRFLQKSVPKLAKASRDPGRKTT